MEKAESRKTRTGRFNCIFLLKRLNPALMASITWLAVGCSPTGETPRHLCCLSF